MTQNTAPWYPALLARAEEALAGLKQNEKSARQFISTCGLTVRDEPEEDSIIPLYWEKQELILPPINPADSAWLRDALRESDSTPSLAYIALNPAGFGFPVDRIYKEQAQVTTEAFRIMLAAAAIDGPPQTENPWRLEQGRGPYESISFRRKIFTHLTSGWSGLQPRQNHFTQATSLRGDSGHDQRTWELLHSLLSDHPLGDDAKYDGHDKVLSVQASFLAWKLGIWTKGRPHPLLNTPLFKVDVLTRSPERSFHSDDPALTAFWTELPDLCQSTLDHQILNGPLEWLCVTYFGVKPGLPAFEVVKRVVDAIQTGSKAEEVVGLLDHLDAPDPDDEAIHRFLSDLDAKTLKALLAAESQWLPTFLGHVSDRKLADLLRVVLGTFADDLLPIHETFVVNPRLQLRSLHPGRSPSGYTNLSPFFEVLDRSPSSTIKKALPILRASCATNDEALQYIAAFSDVPIKRLRPETSELLIRLSERVPSHGERRTKCLNERAQEFALEYFATCRSSRPDLPDYRFLRVCMFAHAEASGLDTHDEALLDFAARWMQNPSLELEGVTLTKVPQSANGIQIKRGNRVLKQIPASLKNAKGVAALQAEAYSLWQTCQYFEKMAVDHYLKSGDMLDIALYTKTMNSPLSATLQARLDRSIPAELENEIRSLSRSEPSKPVELKSLSPTSPATPFRVLEQRGWEHAFGRFVYHGIFSTYGLDTIGGSIALELLLVPVNPNEEAKSGRTPPKTPQRVEASFTKIRGNPEATPESDERVLKLIFSDLTEAFFGS